MLPVVAQYSIEPPAGGLGRARRLAERMRRRQPALEIDDNLAALCPRGLEAGCAVHLDDLSAITGIDEFPQDVFLEQRARLRATGGETVVSCEPRCSVFENYCETHLGLGKVEWLHARPRGSPLQLAVAAWTDRRVRGRLIHGLRHLGLRYVHPYMADAGVWTLAQLLRRASRRPVEVIGPPPELCRRVNDKAWFAAAVRELLGDRALPRTARVWNYAGLATVVRHMAETCKQLVVKLPSSASGVGNVRLDAALFRGHTVGEIRAALRSLLPPPRWRSPGRMLVSGWQSDVLCTPSVQLWIPPLDAGLPVIEGVFEQLVEGRSGMFTGFRPAALPEALTHEIVEKCLLLAVLVQHLGYVGRCSHDLIVTGEALVAGRVEFIECNGRWGGTSLPMTLMNRLFGDWRRRPFATHHCRVPGLAALSFDRVFEALRDGLYHCRTGRGHLILLDAAGVSECDRLDVLALGATEDDASRRASVYLPRALQALVARAVGRRPPALQCG